MRVVVCAGERRFAGVWGGWRSGATVRTRSSGVGSDSLPASSKAVTWKAYSVAGASPVAVQLVPAISTLPPGPWTR